MKMRTMLAALATAATFVFTGCGGGGGSSAGAEAYVDGGGGLEERSYLFNDAYWPEQWNLSGEDSGDESVSLYFDKAVRDFGLTGAGVTIGIVDTNLGDTRPTDHPDMANAMLAGYNLIDTDTPVDDHGLQVMSVMAAEQNNSKGIVGIAPDATYLYAVADYTDKIIEAIDWLVQNGASVINISLNLNREDGYTDDLVAKIRDLHENNGTLFVIGAGNDNTQISGALSQMAPYAIVVGANDEYGQKADYANYGSELDVVAPVGNSIPLLDMNEQDGVSYYSGTSFAAPQVAAVAALMLQANPNLSAAQIEEILKQTADKIGDEPYTDGRNDTFGYGKINADAAIAAAYNAQ